MRFALRVSLVCVRRQADVQAHPLDLCFRANKSVGLIPHTFPF